MTDIAVNETEQLEEAMLFADFLESSPPHSSRMVANLFLKRTNDATILSQPDVQLHCDICKGVRVYYTETKAYAHTEHRCAFLIYTCRNCLKSKKVFALFTLFDVPKADDADGMAMKIGEVPAFGPPVPTRVMSLVGPDRELFLRGRRAENQGLGVGAYAYYRRVVEDQKGRLITEIGKVAKRVGASPEDIKRFEAAATETQFSKAIDDTKAAFPPSLLIGGQNPLSLLHSALSEGIHAGTDEQCLELATSIRVVLTELSERISEALKDEAELRNAVSRLMAKRSGAS